MLQQRQTGDQLFVVAQSSPWPTGLPDWVGLLGDGTTFLVAAAAVALWVRGRNPIVAYALKLDRKRTIGSVLRASGYSRRAVRKAGRAAIRDILNGNRSISVSNELRWLNETASNSGNPVPVTLYGLHGNAHDDLRKISSAYVAFGHRLKSRGLLGGGTAPILSEQAVVAAQTATRLTTDATFALETLTIDGDGSADLTVTRGQTRLALRHLRTGAGPGKGIDALAVSHLHQRLVFTGTLAERLCELDGVQPQSLPTLSQVEEDALKRKLSGKFFDGALPSLLATQRQRDPASGWLRLHLVLAEAAYSTIVATHYVGSSGIGRSREDLDGDAKLLTLSCVPITRDNRIIAVQRSGHVSTGQGQWTTGVNGNLEMRPRFGIALDQDENGVPNPLLALARESREELGIDLDHGSMSVLGLARFNSKQEVGVTTLLTCCYVPLAANEVSSGRSNSHPTEGRWENQGSMLAIPVPTDFASCRELLCWSLGARNQQPHLVASFIALCHPILVDHMNNDADGVRHLLRTLASDSSPAHAFPTGTVEIPPPT